MSLECPVCYNFYNLKDRVPKTLGCHHNVCAICLDRLNHGGSVDCPKCRRQSSLDAVTNNFGLTDVLVEQCEICIKEKRVQKCCHCNRDLCDNCLSVHAAEYQETVKKALEDLRSNMKKAREISEDQTFMDEEKTKETETLVRAKEAFQRRRDELDKLEKQFARDVKVYKDRNTAEHFTWTEALDAQIDKCKLVIRSADKLHLGTAYGSSCTFEHMTEIHKEIEKSSSGLRQTENELPERQDYDFVDADALELVVGKIVCSAPKTNRYCHMSSKVIAATETRSRAYIHAVNGQLVATDHYSHTLNIFDNNLNLKIILGEKGSGNQEFQYPNGVCNIGDELFVSDEHNDRIKVYNEYFQLKRMFGTEGTDADQLSQPYGLAAGPEGHLFICDSENYRVKVVKPDGEYVRHIGSEGTGPGEFFDRPVAVAVNSDGEVLVRVDASSDIHMFKSTGEFIRLLDDYVPDSMETPNVTGLAVDKDDNIILCDNDNDRLIVLTSQGEFICTIGTPGDQPGQLGGPFDVTVNQRGDIIVYEEENHRVQVFGI